MSKAQTRSKAQTKDLPLALVFESIHQVMLIEDRLNEIHIPCDLVPVPREISSECGLSMILQSIDRDKALEIIGKSDVTITGKYYLDNGTFLPYES